MTKKTIILVMCSLLTLVLAGCSKKDVDSQVQKNPNQVQEQGKNTAKKIPSESLSACQGKSEGDSCETSMPRKDESEGDAISGTCKKAPSGNEIACMPQMGPGNGAPNGEKPNGPKPDAEK